MSGKPYPKHQQLKHERLRQLRHVAGRAEMSAIREAKRGPCRCCNVNGRCHLHHLIPRARGGDDVADNLVPLCWVCHDLVHSRDPKTCMRLVWKLTDAEYSYAVEKCGEPVWESVYGIRYER